MKIIIKYIIVIVNLAFINVSNAQNNKIHNDLDTFFNSQLDTFNLVAISASIVKENKVVWTDAYGIKDLETKDIVTPNTLFHQGSISKTITLIAFLHLWEQEKFELNEDINKYLPFEVRNPNHKTTPITFYMLLTHTSGLNDVHISQKDNKMAMLYSNHDTQDKLEITLESILTADGDYFNKEYFLSGKPGTEYAYSNVAYSLLGYLVEHISGIRFTDYCRKYIFEPLQMEKTTFLLSKVDTTDFAYQYYLGQDNPSELIKIQPFTWAGYMDGSLRTTALEYSNFLIMLINNGKFNGNQIFSENIIETMLKIQDLPGEQSNRMFEPCGRALIWNKVRVENVAVYHFNGFGDGFFTEAYFSPDTKMAGLFFTTGQFTSFEQLGRATEEIVKKLIKSTNEF